MSTQIDLGPVLSVPKGDWNANTTYERLNLVRHNSAAWICNVDTSIGVEPSEDSADWFLQVKDTSAVSSVNGMRGDVEITTIQTPSNDSNDTSIANTEWVRDRIDETINSTHSYTDNAISTATTSILSTAAQDASNKATVAVNQALAASETKFATKETVSGLAGNISTLTEHNAAQDTAIAGKLDTSGGDIKYLNFVDGAQGGGYLYASDNTFFVGGRGVDGRDASFVRFYSLNDPKDPGAFMLSTRNADGSWGPVLFGNRDNGLWWDNYRVFTSAGGDMHNAINFLRGQIAGWDGVYGGAELNGNKNSPTTGATFVARAPDAQADPNATIMLARDGRSTAEVKLVPDGTFTRNGERIHSGNAEFMSGDNYNQVRIHLFDNWYIEAGANWSNVKEVTFYTYDNYNMWYDVASWPSGDHSSNYAPGIVSNGSNHITVDRMSRDVTGGPFYFLRIGALI